jgi:hypothetical protein
MAFDLTSTASGRFEVKWIKVTANVNRISTKDFERSD